MSEITLPPALSRCAETTLRTLCFDGIEARVTFLTEQDEQVSLRLPCRCIWSRVDPRGGIFNIGKLRLAGPADWLDVWRGRYVAPSDPAQQMRAARNGFQIMIGMRVADTPRALHFSGATTILLLPVDAEAVPVWQIED